MIEIPGQTPQPPQQPQQSMDLRKLGFPNILPMGGESEEDDPFCGEVPQDTPGYAAYRTHHERKMEQMIGGAKSMSLHANCSFQYPNGHEGSLHHQKPEHMGAGIVIACNHVIYQDPHNPEGGRFYPLSRGKNGGFYLCKTCMKLEERHRLNLDYGISMKCAKCVLEGIMRVMAEHPDRWVNLGAL